MTQNTNRRKSILIMSKPVLMATLALAVVIGIVSIAFAAQGYVSAAPEASTTAHRKGSVLPIAQSQDMSLQASLSAEMAASTGPEAMTSNQELVAQTAGSVTVRVGNYRIDGEVLKMDICYPLPSQADWTPGRPSLVLGDTTILARQVAMTDETARCYWVSFPVTPQTDLTQFTIVVDRLETSPPEQPDCDKAQRKLDAAGSGIAIQCHRSDWSFGYDLVRRPAAMKEAEARKLVGDAFIDILPGPWVFSGRINR